MSSYSFYAAFNDAVDAWYAKAIELGAQSNDSFGISGAPAYCYH